MLHSKDLYTDITKNKKKQLLKSCFFSKFKTTQKSGFFLKLLIRLTESKQTTFQSSNQVFDSKILPDIFFKLIDKISLSINTSLENCFLQIIKMKSGGKIARHYDTSLPGYINYKCNISLLSEDYTLFTNGENIDVKENDLYSFEASLYSHWTEYFNQDRILLSYGFGLEYQTLGRTEEDPRVRMSNRIYKYFQS